MSFAANDNLVDSTPLLLGLTHGNGLSHSRSYNTDNLLNQLTPLDPPSTNRILRTHGYSDNLSLTTITDGVTAAENQSFWLNVQGALDSCRLQNATGPWGADTYTHDGVGNRTYFDRTVSGVTTSRLFSYGAANNRLNSVLIGATTERAFTHDAAGNIAGDNRGAAGNVTYTVNRNGRIANANLNAQLRGAYTYDGSCRRCCERQAS